LATGLDNQRDQNDNPQNGTEQLESLSGNLDELEPLNSNNEPHFFAE